MKIAILGAAGVRTPLIIQAIARRQERIGLKELVLMDIDAERLEIIGTLTAPLETSGSVCFKLSRTTDARTALNGADFVITTFRVGGIESRVIDERVPLNHGVLGQETTGPGGFAMGLRTLPVLLEYVRLMRQACPDAWLINFANPAGMLTEGLRRVAGWDRSVGICDGPTSILGLAAAAIDAPPDEVYLDYFGLNHLGWIRAVRYKNKDYLPQLIRQLQEAGGIAGLHISPDLIAALGMIPNDYLYYYYHARQSVQNILEAGQSRGEQIAALNVRLFERLRQLKTEEDFEGMQQVYESYLNERGVTYMQRETGGEERPLSELDRKAAEYGHGEGYAGVALDVIEGLLGVRPRAMILNIPNQGVIHGMGADEVVEVPAFVGRSRIEPLGVGEIPAHCLGLMKSVKAYERLTVEAAIEGSYSKALTALAIHPLVSDYELARTILDEYIQKHGEYFPIPGSAGHTG